MDTQLVQSEMATEADIPVPVCEARGEQVGNFVDNIVKISVSEVPLEKQNQDDKHNELPIVEGGNFLKSPSTDEVHSEANNVTPDASKVVQKTPTEESQQNAGESNSKDADGDRGVVPEKCSMGSSVTITPELKVGDTIDDPHTDDAMGVTQLSKETSSDHHGTYDSSTENVALTKEILLESSLPNDKTESNTPCISEGEELNVQSKTTDDKSVDEKPTGEDMSSNLTNEMNLEQEALENERSVEENFNTAAEKASHDNSTSGETMTTLDTSDSEKLQNKSDLNTSLSKEEIQQNAEESNSKEEDGDRGVVQEQCSTDSSVVTSEMKVGDTTDDPCTENAAWVTHLSEETSGDHHGTCDSSTENIVLTKEILLESSHPSEETESHTPCISEGEELNVQSKTIDDKSTDEKPAEEDMSSNLTNEMTSEQEALENERSVEDNYNTAAEKASHENSTPRETITTLETSNGDKLHSKSDLNTPLSKEEETAIQKGDKSVTTSEDHGVTSEKTLSESHGDVECQSKTLEDAVTDHNYPKLAEKFEESSPVQVEDSQIEHDEHFEEDSEKLPLTEVSMGPPDDNVVPEATDNVKNKDKDLKEAELPENEQSTSTLVKENVHKENPAESFYVAPEYIEVSDLSQENSVKGPPEKQSRNLTLHGDTNDADDGQKESLESFPTIFSSSHEEGSLKTMEEETAVQKSKEPVTMPEDYGVPSEKTLGESHADVECQFKTLEDAATDHSDPKLVEKSEESLVVQVEDSQIDHNEHLEEESQGLPLTEASSRSTNGNVLPATDEVKEEDEHHKETELSESEQSTKCTLVKEDVQIENPAESLHVALENIEVSNLSQENNIEILPEEQSTKANLHGNTIEAEEATIDATEEQKDSHESFPPIVSGSPKEGSMNAVLQEVTSDYTDEKINDEVGKHEEVSENLSTTVTTEDAEGNSLVKLEGSESKKEDDSGKESEETPLPLPLAREVSDASMFLHEARYEGGQPKKVESCDDERDTESMLPKTESETENTEDVHINSEDTKAPESMDKRSEGGTIDAAAEKEETVENVPTIVQNEMTEENSFIQVDGQETENEEHLDKENEQPSIKDYTANANNDEVIVKDEHKIEDEEPSGAELFEKDKSIQSVLLTEEVQSEKQVESLDAALEDIKTSDFGQHTEATGILEEQIPAEHSQGIHSDETEETGIDAANTNEKTQELQNVSNEDSDKDLLIKVAASDMTRDINLEEEPERPSLTGTSKDEASDKESIMLEPKTSDEYPSKAELPNNEKSTDCTTPKKEGLQTEDHKTSTSSADIETTCSLEEQSLEDNSKTIISNKITDAADKKDLALEKVATETPHEHIEENSVTQVDCSAREHEECLEEDNQNSSLIEAPEETDARESKNIDETKNRGVESITPELENGENTESTYETDVEKHIDSLQVKPEDIKKHDSSPDISKSNEEEISNKDPQEISTDNAKRESVDAAHTNEESVETKDVAKDIPDCDKEDSIPIEEVGSQNPLNEGSAGNANDKESPKVTEGCLIMKEEPLKSLQVAAQDIETPPLSRDRETSSLDEESPTTNTEAIMDDNKEEIPDNATGEEDETPTDKQDIGKYISDCGKEDDMPIEEVGSQKPLNEASAGNANIEESTKIIEGSLIEAEASLESLQEAAQEIETPHLSREREISSPDEQSPIANPEGIRDDNKEKIADSETGLEGETPKNKHNIANTTTPYEDKEENIQVQEDCSRQEQNESENILSSEAPTVSSTESSPVKEEVTVEMPTEVQILTADPQETCNETKEKTVDAANKNNDAVISIPNGDSEDKSPIEVDGLQEPSSEEVPAEKINDDEPTTTHEAKFAYENTVKANLNEDEEKIECALVKEEVHIESLQVADEDIKDTSSGQDREASHLEEQAPTTDSHETMDDEKYAKTLDSTDLKKETLEDKNYAATPDEDTKEDSRNQVDGLLLEQEEHSVKVSESTSLSDAPKDDITESMLVKEVAQVEDPIDSSQVATEDIKAFAPCQDTERSSTVEQILDPEDITSNKITEKIVDATGEDTQEAQDIEKSVPQEDDSPSEQNTEATLIKEDVSIELPQIAAEDREEPRLSEVRETNSQEEQTLCASPGVRINDNEEDKTIDPTVFENETPKDEVPKEMESVDVKGETKEEEGYFKAVQMTTTVIVASNQERSLNLTAEETPCAEDLDVNKHVIGHIPVVSNYKQQGSPVMKVSEEHIMTSNEHVLNSTGMESQVSEKTNDQVVGEANSCGDKTDMEKIDVLNDGPTAVPTSETLAETDSRGCTETEVQVPNGEKEAELFKEEAENDQKNINETLPKCAASEDVLESKEVNGEEEIDSNNCKEISSSPISVASEEVSTSNVALEEDLTSYSVTDLETQNEEEAPAIKETTPSSAEGQDAESISVEENSNYTGSLTEEKSDSNEVAFTPRENKSGYESNNRGLESIVQGQSFDIISKTEETKTEEEDLKAEAGIQSDKDVTEDILQEEITCEKEIMKDDISSKMEQLPRIKEEHEDIKDYHPGSCEEEVITDSHQEDEVKITDSHQEDEVKQDQHLNSKETYEFTNNENDTETVPEVSEEADDKAPEDLEEKIFTNEAIDNILHQEDQTTSIEKPKIDNENAHELDISCAKTDTQDSNKEAVQIAIIPGRESEEQNKEDEICSSDDVQAKDEENLILSERKSKEEDKEAYVKAEKFDLSSQTKDISECAISDVGQEMPEDREKSTTNKFSEEDYPKKIIECEVSSASEDISLTEQPSEDAFITAEEQEAEAGIDLGAVVPVPEATGLESQEVEELNDKCTEMADTSTPVETLVISTSKKLGESTEGTPLEAKDQQTKLHDLPEESDMRDTEVKMAEKDDAVNLQSVRDISEDVQENAPVSETLKQEIEEQKLGTDNVVVHEEEKNIDHIPNQLESVHGAATEKVPESSIHQSSVEDTAQHDTKQGNQQIDSPIFLPHVKCSDIKTSENEPVHVGGLGSADVTELEASPPSLKYKHVVLEADDTRNVIPENLDGDKNISTEHSQGEHEVVKPSKVEQEEEECGNKERTDKEMEGKPESEETGKPSLSDSEMADHSPTQKEPARHTEDMRAENIDEVEHENTKTDEENDDEEESHEQRKSDLGSEAPVMVDIGDADMKVTHKKSHNILSGVGSKVKHSIAKVKKAITGKSPSPKKVINPESK